MKKIFTAIAAALLLAGCAEKYDDSAVLARLDALETRVSALETSVDALRSAIGDGVFVSKVEEFKDPTTGKTTGITVTYTSGDVKYFTISPAEETDAPVISIIQDGTGALCWAVDGILLQVGGQNVPVYQTPVFSMDKDGNLCVTVDGETIVLGQVKAEGGATLQDGIFTNLAVTDNAVVLTLADGSTVNIPFAEAFRLNITATEFQVSGTDPIEIPYTVSAKTASTVVDVWCPANFSAKVEEDKITVTPLVAGATGELLAYADSKVGLTSIVKLCFEGEVFSISDVPASETADYIAAAEGGNLKVNVVSNVEFEVKPEVDWITYVNTKSVAAYVITLNVAENTGAARNGEVKIMKKGTETLLQTIKVAQAAATGGARNLGAQGTANCYIVTEAGEYKFAAVKGNSDESVGAAASAEVLWETWNTDEEVTANSVVASASFTDGFVNFKVADGFHPGNAIIAVKDASDAILWSWHIWIPETEIVFASYDALMGGDLMDRNLGALVAAEAAGAPVSPKSFGLLYQWGRKDPFVGAGSLNSSAEKAKVAGMAFAKAKEPVTIAYSIANPTTFAYNAATAVDPDWKGENWCSEDNDTAWDAEKTIYDPCPAGYKVPERGSAPFWGSASWTYDGTNGWALASEAVFPTGGILDDCGGGLAYTTKRTIVWSSVSYSSDNKRARAMQIRTDSSKAEGTNAWKSRAASVRCVAETAE